MSGNFRFRPAACASYASPTLGTTNLPPRKIGESIRPSPEKQDYRNVALHLPVATFTFLWLVFGGDLDADALVGIIARATFHAIVRCDLASLAQRFVIIGRYADCRAQLL